MSYINIEVFKNFYHKNFQDCHAIEPSKTIILKEIEEQLDRLNKDIPSIKVEDAQSQINNFFSSGELFDTGNCAALMVTNFAEFKDTLLVGESDSL